jgi:Flp pilus assembly protein TadB
MKIIVSILFFALAFTCKSQDATSRNMEDANRKEQAVATNDIQNTDASKLNPESEPKENVASENADSKIEKEKTNNKTIADKKSQNKKGRRGNSNILIYVAIGIVAVAVIVYIATSSSTTKM